MSQIGKFFDVAKLEAFAVINYKYSYVNSEALSFALVPCESLTLGDMVAIGKELKLRQLDHVWFFCPKTFTKEEDRSSDIGTVKSDFPSFGCKLPKMEKKEKAIFTFKKMNP